MILHVRYTSAKKEAARAAESVQRFLKQVEDGKVRAEIDKQLAELERLLAEL